MKETSARKLAREKAVRNSEIAKIHIAAIACGLDDEAYRALLWRMAGVRSAKELTQDGRVLVIDEFIRRGWREGAPRGAGRLVPKTDEPQIRLIRGLWLELRDLGALRDESQRALGNFCERVSGVSTVEWLGPKEAGKLIAALSQWIQRVKHQRTESA